MPTEKIAGIAIPDTEIVRSATALVRDTTDDLIYHHSRRVFLFGSLQALALDIEPDPELLYAAAMFHDTGLVQPYRTDSQRFEIDGADEARDFLATHDVAPADADIVWTAIALHTTPEVAYRMHPVVAATTAGVESDVLGLNLDNIPRRLREEVVAAHPRPRFKQRILSAFNEGFKNRPETTFGTVNADVLVHFDPEFTRTDFVQVILDSDWPE
ncbi:HD domain-containing protein [Leifsonia sp. NPDC077715]|uniref:HD domain-containing protein n=1 Tax=Leifsonia sp. NPDC077715 TaxID=3155539 RepID=UPI003412F1C2